MAFVMSWSAPRASCSGGVRYFNPRNACQEGPGLAPLPMSAGACLGRPARRTPGQHTQQAYLIS